MSTLNFETETVFGPFHRLFAPDVQDATTVLKQIRSGELWGRSPNYGGSPAVKAYRGRLPDDRPGIEFWAFQQPDAPHGPRAFWRTPGPWVMLRADTETVVLTVAFARVTQDLGTIDS